MTIGAEYYAPTLLDAFARIVGSGLPTKYLSDCCSLITDGDHGSADYQETGVPFILSEAVNEGWLSTDKFRYISESHSATLQRSELHPGDVLLTKTGVYFGKSAVLPDSISVANTIAHVAKLVVKKFVNPYYLSTFFNSTYGYLQLLRRAIKATRPEMKLVEMQDILVPLPSVGFQTSIEQLVKLGLRVNDDQEQLYSQAETLLLDALHLTHWQAPTPLAYEQPASAAFAAGRLDAEYYQPKHQSLFDHLQSQGAFRLGDRLAEPIQRGITPDEYGEEGDLRVINSRYVGTTHVDIESTRFTSSALHPGTKGRVQQYDVLLNSTGRDTIGRCQCLLEDVEALTDNHVAILRPIASLDPVYLACFLNSPLGQQQTERGWTGSSGQIELRADVVADYLIWDAPSTLQKQIRANVEAAHTARRQAKQLLEAAKRAVEIAIEEGEAAGLAFLQTVSTT